MYLAKLHTMRCHVDVQRLGRAERKGSDEGGDCEKTEFHSVLSLVYDYSLPIRASALL